MDELQLQEDVLTAALYSVLGTGQHDIECSVYYGTFKMRVRVNDPAIGGKSRIILYQNNKSKSKGQEHIVACLVNALVNNIPEGYSIDVKVHGKKWEVNHDVNGINVYKSSLWSVIKGWFGL